MNILMRTALRGIADTVDAVVNKVERIQLQSPVRVEPTTRDKAHQHRRLCQTIAKLRQRQAVLCKKAQHLETEANRLAEELKTEGCPMQVLIDQANNA